MERPLNLRTVDLNLLVFFDALMSERHVTRAAEKVAITQPAMSNALSRLRLLFKDELFVRTAKGMEPTPRAFELGIQVQSILQQASRLLTSDIQFDPGTALREFNARMSDLVGLLILPRLMAQLAAEAPRISLHTVHLSPDATIEALETDRLDIAVSMDLHHTSSIRSEVLFSDQMVCVMAASHPLATQKFAMKDFLAYRHVRVAMSPTDIRFVDSVLARQGLHRNVALNVTHWLLVAPVLERTDFITVMSEHAARRLIGPGLAIRPLPFETPHFSWQLYWHGRYEHSRSHQWLRNKFHEAAASTPLDD